ncbi:MAG: hypothetical protein PVF20_06890 [Desulfobacterales bacterium]
MNTDSHDGKESVLYTWIVILLLLALILFKGAFALKWVGDVGQPGWDYRPVMGVPAESPYGVYKPLPYTQHIRGPEGR